MRPTQRWLRSDDPEKFAQAMLKCQHHAAYCAQDGMCHLGGDCFRSAKSSKNEAVRMIRNISSTDMEDSAMVRAWLNDAADWLANQPT